MLGIYKDGKEVGCYCSHHQYIEVNTLDAELISILRGLGYRKDRKVSDRWFLPGGVATVYTLTNMLTAKGYVF